MDLFQVTYPRTSLEEVAFQSTNEDSLDWPEGLDHEDSLDYQEVKRHSAPQRPVIKVDFMIVKALYVGRYQ